jgi:hypothetical protein
MVVEAITFSGIGFMLGVAINDKLIATPLRVSLNNIKAFGYRNSGYGYTCARMAELGLKETK